MSTLRQFTKAVELLTEIKGEFYWCRFIGDFENMTLMRDYFEAVLKANEQIFIHAINTLGVIDPKKFFFKSKELKRKHEVIIENVEHCGLNFFINEKFRGYITLLDYIGENDALAVLNKIPKEIKNNKLKTQNYLYGWDENIIFSPYARRVLEGKK